MGTESPSLAKKGMGISRHHDRHILRGFSFLRDRQNNTFSTWPADHAKAYYQVLRGAELMDEMNQKMRWFNWSVGWLHPIAFVTYGEYTKAIDMYSESLRVSLMIKSPETLDSHMITVHVKADVVTKLQETVLIIVTGYKLRVFCDPGTEVTEPFEVKGIAKVRDNWITVDMRRKANGAVEGNSRIPSLSSIK